MSETTTVTKIIDRIPRPGREAELEQAIKDLNAAAMRFPGHLGVTVTRPSPPGQPGFRTVFRFDNCEHLRAWEESDGYVRLIEAANLHTQGEPHRQVVTGLEAWFSLPGSAATPPPPRGRMSVVTWIGIFPLVYLYEIALRWILPGGTPTALSIGMNTALVVLTMSYVVGPPLTRLFRPWLYP